MSLLLLIVSVTTLLLGTTAADPGADQSNVETACEDLVKILPGAVHLSSSANYSTLVSENWSATATAHPACIVVPASAAEVQKIVELLVGEQVQFAIRSGGHSPSPGAANIDNGVLIDLADLNGITYDAASSTVVVGTGNRWNAVYTALDPYNVTVVGGRVVDVGVGGFLLQSGLSYLSDLYGLGCDNVVEHEVVLANGSLVTASADQHPDLHWALKGGANNFGVVTSFKLSTYQIHLVWGGFKFYALDQLPALYAAMAEYQAAPNKDPYANVMLQAFTTNATNGAVLDIVYLKPEADPAAFAPFYSIPTTGDTTQIQTLTDMMSAQYVPDIPRIDWFATSFLPDAGLYEAINNITTSAANLAPIESLTAGSMAIGLQPISASLVLAGQERGGNVFGLSAINQTWFVLDSGWWLPSEDDPGHNATLDIQESIWDAAVERGLEVEYIFANDASYSQAVLQSYGSENVAKMKDVQARYDPHMVFQRLVPGGFKLGL
ncbi:putative FAD-binding oxidoreductase [Truncatella angustata]|uniref:FAD-binding oxidoreductase n=1 Tax=Truncatella angustata TaxID=152316 RepID=A0A9P8ZYE4_9PEZI|nr:putative FAD-binding oxidoreductase [Truncatella angustata]KAH6655956.1 putative FAD-binding oxidoreductase [Truncatella angustata]